MNIPSPFSLFATVPISAPAWVRYAGAVGLVMAVAGLRRLLGTFPYDAGAFALFYVAILLSALLGGFRAGLVATAAALVMSRGFVTPGAELSGGRELVSLLLHLAQSIVITFIGHSLRMSGQRQQAAELARHEADERFRNVFQSAAVGIALVGWDGRIQQTNPFLAALLGRSEAELLNVDFTTLIHPDDLAATRALVRRLELGDLREFQIENRNLRKDGEVIWVRKFISPVRDSAGKPLQMMMIVIDITAQKRATEALRQSEARFRLALERAPITVYENDRELRYTWVYNADHNYTNESMLGKRDDELLPEESVAPLMALKRQVMASGTGAQERITTTIHGKEFTYVVTAEPLHDTEGTLNGVTVAVMDVSEQERMQAALREREHFLQAVLGALPAILFIWDIREQRLVYLNDYVSTALGYRADDFRASGLAIIRDVLPTDFNRLMTHFSGLVRADGKAITPEEYQVQHKDGSWHSFQTHEVIFVRDEAGVPSQVLGIAQDITHRKQAEEARLEGERKFHALFDTLEDGFCICQVLLDVDGSPCDYRFLEVNPRFEAHTGLKDAAGRTALELVPNLERHWIEIYGRVALKREPYRFEQGSAVMGRWFEVLAFPFGPPELLQIGILFRDVSERKRIEEQLRTREQRLAIATDAAALGVFEWRPAEDVALWENHRPYEIFGHTRADGTLTRRRFLDDYLHPDDRSEFDDTLTRAMEQRRPWQFTGRIYRKDGALRWLELNGRFEYQGEMVTRLIGVVADITERTQAAAALRENEEQLRLAKLAAGLGVYDWDILAGPLQWDERVRELWGVGTDEPVDIHTFFAGLHPDDRAHTQAALDRALDAAGGGAYKAEYRVIHRRTGDVRWIEAIGQVVAFRGGQAARLIGMVLDVTERRLREEQVQRQRDVLEQILNSIPVMITIRDPETNTRYVNQEFERLVGWTNAEVRSVQATEDPEAQYRAMIFNFIDSFEPGWHDFLIKAGDGSLVDSSWANVHLSDGRRVGIGIDLSARRQTEQRALYLQNLAAALSTAVTQAEVAEIFLQRCVRAMGARGGTIFLLDETGDELQLVGMHGYPQDVREKWRTLSVDHLTAAVARAVRTKQALWLTSRRERAEILPDTPNLSQAEQHEAWVAMPFNINDTLIGGLGLGFDAPREFDITDRAFLYTLTDYCAQALDRARLTERMSVLAALEERNRLARDLHDAVSQVLFASSSMSEAIPRIWQSDPEAGMAYLRDIVTLNRGAWAEMRKLLLELRPEAIVRTPFGQLLDHLVRAAQAQKSMEIVLDAHFEGNDFLPPEAHTTLYRIAQEAFNNIIKHSFAQTVEVVCGFAEGIFQMTIRDDGVGFDVQGSTMGLGMSGMLERALAIGASLKVISAPGQGTEITIVWQGVLTGQGTGEGRA